MYEFTIKPFKCDMCGKRLSYSSSLKIHVRIHTDEKPFKCDTCAAHFLHSGTLRSHMCTHTDEKQFKCKTFEAHFLDSGDLKLLTRYMCALTHVKNTLIMTTVEHSSYTVVILSPQWGETLQM